MALLRTLYDKIWDAHAVAEDDGETLLYFDLHLLHEVTSPQACRSGGPARAQLEGRMTLCNLSIEMGTRAGLIAADPLSCQRLHIMRGNEHVGVDIGERQARRHHPDEFLHNISINLVY